MTPKQGQGASTSRNYTSVINKWPKNHLYVSITFINRQRERCNRCRVPSPQPKFKCNPWPHPHHQSLCHGRLGPSGPCQEHVMFVQYVQRGTRVVGPIPDINDARPSPSPTFIALNAVVLIRISSRTCVLQRLGGHVMLVCPPYLDD